MNGEPENSDRRDDPAKSTETSVKPTPSGCLTAFVVLWGIAFLLVGLLFASVSGYCAYIFIANGGGRDSLGFGKFFVVGCIIGVGICVLGIFMVRGAGRNR